MHCATISTHVGAVSRIVIDGETGFLVQPGDVEALTSGAALTWTGPAAASGQAIFEKVKREFSIDATVGPRWRSYETILRRLSHRRGPEGRASSSAEPMETAMWVMRPF